MLVSQEDLLLLLRNSRREGGSINKQERNKGKLADLCIRKKLFVNHVLSIESRRS